MADRDEPYRVLFLCTGNSARSILAESLVNRLGEGRFQGYSAGSLPTGRVNPHAVKLLRSLGYPTGDLRSKDWSEFAGANSPSMTSSLRSATTPPERSARCGPAGR